MSLVYSALLSFVYRLEYHLCSLLAQIMILKKSNQIVIRPCKDLEKEKDYTTCLMRVAGRHKNPGSVISVRSLSSVRRDTTSMIVCIARSTLDLARSTNHLASENDLIGRNRLSVKELHEDYSKRRLHTAERHRPKPRCKLHE